MREFIEETETWFMQDETCYVHYKEMQRSDNQKTIKREDKKFFNYQLNVQSKEAGLFQKLVPTWASDYGNLAKVSKLQATILDKLGAKTTSWILPQELTHNSMGSPRATAQMTTAVS